MRRIESTMRPVPPGLTRPETIRVDLCACLGCGLEFNLELLEGKDFAALYTEEAIYSSGDYVYAGEVNPKYTADVLTLLLEHRSGGRLLEVGFLDTASLRGYADAGFTVSGVDLDAQAVERALAEGFDAHQSDLGALRDAGHRFDVVVAVAVLEHVEDPREFLAAAHGLLADDGLLVLQLPNAGALNRHVSRLSRHDWDMYGEPGHVFHYRRAHLERLVARTGFRTVRYTTSTIRIRGKVPVLPGRLPGLERQVGIVTHRWPLAMTLYTAGLAALDRVSLGDTHLLIATPQPPEGAR